MLQKLCPEFRVLPLIKPNNSNGDRIVGKDNNHCLFSMFLHNRAIVILVLVVAGWLLKSNQSIVEIVRLP